MKKTIFLQIFITIINFFRTNHMIYNSNKYSEWIQKERKIWENLMINKLQLTLSKTNKKFNIIRI